MRKGFVVGLLLLVGLSWGHVDSRNGATVVHGATSGLCTDCSVGSLTVAGATTTSSLAVTNKIISNAGSGAVAYEGTRQSLFCLTDNRCDGAGSESHFLSSNGDNFVINADSGGGGLILTAPNVTVSKTGGGNFNVNAMKVRNEENGDPVRVDDVQGLLLNPKTLPTCIAAATTTNNAQAPRGTIAQDALGGTGGKGVKVCVCVLEDDGETANWRNIFAPGTQGTDSTCPDSPF